MSTPLKQLNAKIFREQLHTKFKVHESGGEPMLLELEKVEERHDSPETELFSLQFLGPFTPRLEQKIYRLEHEKLGDFEIFLTAIAADQQGTMYESVFHRFRNKPA
ncbi:MAG TPA: hypothetical protein VKL99_11360 [Candidatus Angelobacter sp.]|nr:hypothetical protein [Candidatus Angelobacter sp.]